MMGLYLKIVLVIYLTSSYQKCYAELTADNSNSDIDSTNTGQISLQVDHSIDDGYTFSNRGNLLIHSLRSGSASMDTSGSEGDDLYVTQEQKDSLRKLCEKDSLYLLRLTGPDGSIHRTATHACNLVKSGKKVAIAIFLSGRVKFTPQDAPIVFDINFMFRAI